MPRPIKICTIMPPPLPIADPLLGLQIEPTDSVATTTDNIGAREGVLAKGKRWQPGTTLRVTFLEGDPVVQKRVIAIAMEWSNYANIRFDFVADPQADIRIAFDPRAGSWSYVGTDCRLLQLKGKPTMNLGWLRPTTRNTEYRRVVLHEFGHAIGLEHEHLSPNATIPWDEQAVFAFYRETNGWTDEYTRSNVLRPVAADAFTRFDPKSIMLYPVPKELLRDPAAAVPWSNTELSELDKQFIGEVYPQRR